MPLVDSSGLTGHRDGPQATVVLPSGRHHQISSQKAAAEVGSKRYRNHKLPRLGPSAATDGDSFINIDDADDEIGVTLDDLGILHWKMISTPSNCKDTRGAWDSTGAMRCTRMPRGKPPVARAHGVIWLYMIGSYVLLSYTLAQYMSCKLGSTRSRDYNTIKIGYVAIPSDLADDVVYHLGHHSP
ncbi:hypothetical protein N7454_005452 [Penicillium verhagenii]|nr:hypothetical protein N7454_005452 [Penicillium verhagenii]